VKIFIGVDPGITGGLAALSEDNEPLALDFMPSETISTGRRQVSLIQLNIWFQRVVEMGEIEMVTVEQVSSMPGNGAASMFSFGASFCAAYAVPTLLGLPLQFVRPSKWKRALELVGREKDYSRTLINQLYPQLNLLRKKDIDRAEALLIALYGKKNT